MNNQQLNMLGGIILDSAITVHRELGPGLLESAYQFALAKELSIRNIRYRPFVPVDLTYKGEPLGKAYVIDLLIEEMIIVEIKSVDGLTPIFESQLLTYLRLSNKKLGYLINFNVPLLKNGFKRFVNNF